MASSPSCHSLQVLEVDLGVVPGDEALQLGRGEHADPLGLDDGPEATDESGGLALDLGVHPEMCHQVDVADPVGQAGATGDMELPGVPRTHH